MNLKIKNIKKDIFIESTKLKNSLTTTTTTTTVIALHTFIYLYIHGICGCNSIRVFGVASRALFDSHMCIKYVGVDVGDFILVVVYINTQNISMDKR